MERVLEAKVLAPALPQVLVDRPRVDRVLAEAVTRRLTAIVAPAGFGKSTLLAAWADQHRCAWYTLTEDDTDLDTLFRGVVAALRLRVTGIGEAVRDVASSGGERGPDAAHEDPARAAAHAAYLSLQLQDRLTSDLVLVLDDLHELDTGSASARFVEALCRQAPHGLHLVVLSRQELPFPVARLRSQGQAAELSGAMLAFDLAETTALAAQVGAPDVHEAARQVHATTLGWPAAVRLGTEALRERARLPAPAQRDDLSPEEIIDLLAGEVFAHTEPALTELVRRTTPLDGFTAGVCAALGVTNPETAIGTLERRGLLRAHPGLTTGWYSLHPLVRAWAERQWSDPAEADRAREVAAGWMLEQGLLREALHLLAAADRREALMEALVQHGPTVLAEGGAEDLLRHLRQLADRHGPVAGTRPELLQLEGEARHTVGDWDGALACFDRLHSGELLPAGAAWRSGFIHHQRGDLTRALAAYERCAPAEQPTADHAMVDAFHAAAHWLRGDLTRCRELAERAHDVARTLDDDRSLAAAHTALAMLAALAGDRRTNDAHYLRALTHAERAGDTLQLIRIHCNRGSRHLEEGDYDDALAELDTSIGLADLAGYSTLRAIALTNRGQVLLRTGLLDEALRDLTVARTSFERTGAHLLAYPLGYLGDVHAARNEVALAGAAYEEAIALADAAGDVQGLVPALCGLARLVLATDPGRAAELADRAVAAGPMISHAQAIVTQGWAALADGDLARARECAAAASEAARGQRDRSALTESVELSARAAEDPAGARHLLAEAATSWERLGHLLDAARVRVLLGTRSDADEDDRRAADAALDVLQVAGARRDLALAQQATGDGSVATARLLGAFRLTVGARAIGPGDWGSRKARDLLKLLLARGGPVRREEVLELLWPEDPTRAARKLSVALSTLRGLLDPGHDLAADHFLVADRDSVWLQSDHWDVDAHYFVRLGTEGLRLAEAGAPSGLAHLARAEALFEGDAFEEDAYAEWSQGLREQVRALSVNVLRALADQAVGDQAWDRAVRLLLRLLERDPYDERAHRALVHSMTAGGRHGEARRVYRTYCERMEEIGVEPAPFPDPNGLRSPSPVSAAAPRSHRPPGSPAPPG